MSLVTFLRKKVGSSEPLDLFCYTMFACVSPNVYYGMVSNIAKAQVN